MKESNLNMDTEKCSENGPQSPIERQFIKDFWLKKGYRLEDLHELPEKEANELIKAACLYASLKLAEVEAKGRFREEIRY